MTTLLRAALVIGAIAWFSPTHEQGGAERAASALAKVSGAATAEASRQALGSDGLAMKLLGSEQGRSALATAALGAAATRAAAAR